MSVFLDRIYPTYLISKPPDNKEANVYYHLGRASLSLRSVFDSPEIVTVQAVLLMAAYHGNAGKRYTMDSSVSVVTQNTQN
jgi:hypothetical protein